MSVKVGDKVESIKWPRFCDRITLENEADSFDVLLTIHPSKKRVAPCPSSYSGETYADA
jgi:hypothetical protein